MQYSRQYQSPEERELMAVQQSMQEELVEQHCMAERIVAERMDRRRGKMFLVKVGEVVLGVWMWAVLDDLPPYLNAWGGRHANGYACMLCSARAAALVQRCAQPCRVA